MFLFSIFLLIGTVGSAGGTSYTIGSVWSILGRIDFGSELSNQETPSTNTFDLCPISIPGTGGVFESEAGREIGGSFGRFFLNTSYGYGGRISSVLNDKLDSRKELNGVNITKVSPPVTLVPEPDTMLMVGIGMLGLALVARKKIKP